jgi:hypothetical protein
MIDVSDISAAELLAALYNNSRAQGLGFLHYTPEPMTTAEAEKLIKARSYFDYIQGRVMKVEINGKTLDPWLYDRDNGEGAAQRVVDELRERGAVDEEEKP